MNCLLCYFANISMDIHPFIANFDIENEYNCINEVKHLNGRFGPILADFGRFLAEFWPIFIKIALAAKRLEII